MPSFARARQPATTSTLRQARGPIALPNYEPTSYPLNNNAQNALHDLQRNHKLESLKTRLQKANDHLTEAAADVNDRLHAKAVKQEKVKKRREAATSQGSNGVDDEEYDELKIATDDMTETLEQRVRNIIDAKAEVLNIETALKELDENATNNRGFIAPTQSTIGASQFRGSKRRRQGGGGENEDENETQKPSESAGLLGTLQRKIAEHTSEYQTSSLAQRYAAHNDYVGFKRIVHDARHPGDNAPPLPHASTWFPSEGGLTHDASFSRHGSTQIDDDDDLEVASERISTKCPLTLRVMKDPVQSTKCPHNFEKEAILEMINLSEVRDDEGRGRAGKKAMKCPQCEIVRKTPSMLLHLLRTLI